MKTKRFVGALGLFAIPALLLGGTVALAAATPPGKTQQLTSPDQVPDGLAKSDWQSIRAAYEAGRHAFQPIEGGWQARNPGQQWITKFDARGFVAEPRDGGWQWGLELKGYGFPGAERVIRGVPAVKAEGQRLAYGWDAAVEEWFVNDARGLEHGFTVKERPAGAPSLNSQPSTLNFLLAVRGTLAARVAADGLGVEFRDAAGATVLTYSGLKVWDADGKILASRFALADSPLSTLNAQPTVRLLVEERGARYPLTIDPIAQQAYLKPAAVGTTQDSDNFGQSVAVSRDTVVIGAPLEDSSTTGINSTPNESAADSGAAYVFVRSGTTWTQQAYLKPAAVATTQAGDQFGYSVAISGDTVVVGAYLEDSSTTGINSVPNESATQSGAAYVFVRSGATWTQQAYLKPAAVGTSQQFDGFGWSVAIASNTVVVGAYSEASSTTGINSAPNESAGGSGAAYVFTRSGTTWTQQAYLKPAAVGTTQVNDYFGYSVAIASNTVVVGALYEDSNTTGVNSTPNDTGGPNFESGAAYVFVRSGTTWTQQAYLKPAAVGTTQQSDEFGSSVAVSGDTVVVGARRESSSTTGINSVPNESTIQAGAAYVFVRSGTTWTQQAYLKPAAVGTSQQFDKFGWSVAVSGDTVVVGAPGEASSTTGINTTPDESSSEAGAAYVFTRSGTTWTQLAYLKPAAVGAAQQGDSFGTSVAVSGNTVIVGAIEEDSSTTGVNSAPNEDSPASGAAYVFAIPPTVTGIAPAIGPTAGGTSVTITGTGFNEVTGVILGGSPATSVNVVSKTSLTAITGVHAPGLVDVEVQAGGPGTGANLFTYAVAPTVVFVNPPGGGTVGGTSVAIHGTDFTGATSVKFGGTTASFTVDSDSKITATTPAHGAGLVDVSVTLPPLTGTGTGLFTYVNLSTTTDIDGDGLNDAAELALAGLGFDWQVAQPELVNSFTSGNMLYTPAQLQALSMDSPLLQRDAITGKFRLTIGVLKSTNLATVPFSDFPMNGPGTATSINAQGKLEFEFPGPDNTAFFRLVAKPPRPLAFSSAVADFQQAAPYVISNSLLPNVEGWGVFGGVDAVRTGYFNFSAPASGDVLEIALLQNFGGRAWMQQFELAVTTDPVPNTAGGGNWTTWLPTFLNSTSTTLSLVGGTNILSTGTAPIATYTLRGAFPVQGITGVRLTVHPYDYDALDALPATVGRSSNGNFVLSEIKATADP